MNVKPGDLAIIVAGEPANLGTLVAVLRLDEIDRWGTVWWRCKLLSTAQRVYTHFDQRYPAIRQPPGAVVLIADIIMRPLRGDLRGEEYGDQSPADLTERHPAERV
jgi:hypothetical protein